MNGWKYLIIALLSLLLCHTTAVAQGPDAARLLASGNAGYAGKRLAVKSAAARWRPGDRELIVGLFPVAVTDADIDTLRETEMMFYVVAGKESPDPEKWPSMPYLVAVMRFKGDKATYTQADVSDYMLNIVKWKEQGTVAVLLPDDAIHAVVRQLHFSPGNLKGLKLHIAEESDRSSMAEGFRYDVKVQPK